VRRAGCGLNVRKIILDLTKRHVVLDPKRTGTIPRFNIPEWTNAHIPVHLVDDLNHGTILTDPTAELISLVTDALKVDSADDFATWLAKADAHGRMATMGEQFQQFIVRALDERGDPIDDYHLELSTGSAAAADAIDAFDEDVAVYDGDASYRCFHVDVRAFAGISDLKMRIIAKAKSTHIEYLGYEAEESAPDADLPVTSQETWDAEFDLAPLLHPDHKPPFLLPYTTTLVELYLDREPRGDLVTLKSP
jgi:hypothetical protein